MQMMLSLEQMMLSLKKRTLGWTQGMDLDSMHWPLEGLLLD